MRKIKRWSALGLSAVLCMSMMAGCGNSDDKAVKEEKKEKAGTENAAEENDKDAVTITIVDWNTGVASELQKAACKEYMD